MGDNEKIEEWFADLYISLASNNLKYYSNLANEICKEFIPKDLSLKVLDVGTGPGYLPIEISLRRSKLKIRGTDLNNKLIKYAKEISRGITKRDISFSVSDANNLLFEDNSFDIVISTGALHAFNDPAKVFDEFYRVLLPKGKCIIYDPVRIKMGKEMLDTPYLKEKWEHYCLKKIRQRESINPKCYSIKEAKSFIEKSKFSLIELIEKNKKENYLKIVLRKDWKK